MCNKGTQTLSFLAMLTHEVVVGTVSLSTGNCASEAKMSLTKKRVIFLYYLHNLTLGRSLFILYIHLKVHLEGKKKMVNLLF